ncbi:hypothetical protein AOL_s00004g13 [Orbilia oligospora ATCC 24927]|uniref:UvrD-like helicase ATP-binding domain-containing protein n=1 Tax=Arthrobotrys oligospora (strain ATCC 24927 / CBS 115.81 / DSM 1491) TaxID=756982 RepID=G1WXK3_ARTOA|nr:hypothetical protein AOL_s00004g13 [Orbilia oligospora ATCC 24927]EGX54364.1 hypothetical protein AOL_s00004g13 [Orbilia oligospora ATCC 24927]
MDYRAIPLPTSNKLVLQDIIISKKEPEPCEYERVYRILVDDDGPIIALLERSSRNHNFRSAFIASPDEMLPRLSHFLRCLRKNLLPQNTQLANSVGGIGYATANKLIRIPAAFTKHLILVLADEPAAIFDIGSSGYHDFILCVLDLYVSLAGIATVSLVTLRDLVSKILDMPRRVRIIEKIVSGTAGAALLTELLAKDSLVRQVFRDGSLRLFGGRLAELVKDCIASHGSGIDDIVLVWEKIEGLQENLETQVRNIESRVRVAAVGEVPIHLNEDEQELLNSARIAIPYNITTAGHTIRALLERYRGHIRLIISSFPCSTCQARLSGIIRTGNENIYSSESQRGLPDIKTQLGVFPIYLSDAAMRDLKSSRVDGTLSKILTTLQKLADGMWESDPDLSVSKGKSQGKFEPVLRAARWSVDGYVIWERGVGRTEENSGEWIQIVKVIRIGSKNDVKKVESDARKAQRTYTKEYKQAATIRIPNSARPGSLIPQTFTGENAVGLEVNNAVLFGSSPSKALPPADALILHKIFCTGKQYCLTKRVAEMILQGGHQAEVPFVVSPEEESIINYFDSSVCILGRSGTGKTTCLVFRLLSTYIRDRLTNDSKEVRQIFLTRSPVLAGKIRQYVNRLINSHCMRFAVQSGITEAGDFSRIIDDEEMGTTGLIDVDNKSWPMVCTYDSFATMLEQSLKFAQRNVFSSTSEESRLEVANRRVDFGKFKRSYWPSFPSSAKRGLSADGVFSEIIGVIKVNSSASNYLPLSKEEYQSLSRRAAPNFHQGKEREAVYVLYEIYEKRKTSFGEWDDLDRTSKIQRLLAQDEKLSSRLRSQITEVFVDEVQDQRLAEIELLLDLVNDTKAFAFAGDTAQCISRDSCFRFQDLQSVFFRKYERLGMLANQKDLAKLNRFTLSKNYRTHNGILKLAAKVVDNLSTAFPYAIDKFSPELGDFDGPAPIIFSGFTSEIFTPREGESNATISEFGAEQVLIVRDEEAKDTLMGTMGDKVLILTILESKGMEFQDVFLFDFFSGSFCTTAFRALSNSQTTGAHLDDARYPELCIELKNLYVAITRSREVLYIIESDVTAVQPLQEMWGNGSGDPVVDLVTSDDPTLQTRLDEIRHGQSQPDEWKEKGDEFVNQRMYEQAMYCYKRAGNVILADMCKALIEERNGRDVISDPNSFKVAREHYIEAARLFRKCNRNDKALKCYESIRDYKLAGELCEELSRIQEYANQNYGRRAADYFMQAGLVLRATELYKDLGLHELVVKGYRKLDRVKDLIQYLKKHQKEIDSKLYHQNSRIIALSIFSSESASNDLRRMAISLLSSQEHEQLYKQFKFHGELSKLLISQCRLEEAIELAYAEGKWEEVGDLLNRITSTAARDTEFFTTNGGRFVERVLFYELSDSLQDSLQKGNIKSGPFKRKLASQNLVAYQQSLKLFQELSEALSQDIFGSLDASSGVPGGVSRDARTLEGLMILKVLALNGKKYPSYSLNNGFLMMHIIRQCAYRLLDMHRSRVLVDDSIILLFFEVIPGNSSDGYNIPRSSPIYEGDGYRAQKVTSDELIDRILRVLREWIAKGYKECTLQLEKEYWRSSACQHFVIRGYCYHQDCTHGLHKAVLGESEMIRTLNISWSMALLTSHYEYLSRNGALGWDTDQTQWDTIKRQGHLWWKRVFECVTVTSDLLQSPFTRLYLVGIKSSALKNIVDTDKYLQREASTILGCLDKFEWRLKAMIRNMSLPGAEKIDFWNLINCWEKIVSSNFRRSHEKELWWSYLLRIELNGRYTMQLLDRLENCLWDRSRTISAMKAFAKNFKRNLTNFTEFKDAHLFLNRLDRVVAIVLYLGSTNNLVLKKSQLEYLQHHPALNTNGNKEINPEITAAANNVLYDIVDIYNVISEKVRSSQKPLWYKYAMYRRIEAGSIIAMLNSKTPTAITGAREFIRTFYTQAGKENFWVVRGGLPSASALTRHAVMSRPKHDHQFFGWILKNINVVQSEVDPIVYSPLNQKLQQPKMLSSLPTMQFQVPKNTNVESSSGTEGTVDDQSIDDFKAIEEADTKTAEKLQLQVKAVTLIQRNWRICGIALRNARYVDQNPTHKRITKILDSPEFPGAKSTLSQKCFRMVAFVFFDMMMKIRSQLRTITAGLENVSRRNSSMEVMEKVLSGYELVNDYDEQLAVIEKSIEMSALGSDSQKKSIVVQLVKIIRKTEGLAQTISATQSDLGGWIQALKQQI